MKNIVLFLSCILILVLTSCNTYEFEVPLLGLWQSDNPTITFEVTDDSGGYYGTYIKDGEEVGIVVVFSEFNNRFSIYNSIIAGENFNESMSDYEYFHGAFTIEGDKIYYTLLPHWQEAHGVKEIVFTKDTQGHGDDTG